MLYFIYSTCVSMIIYYMYALYTVQKWLLQSLFIKIDSLMFTVCMAIMLTHSFIKIILNQHFKHS